MERTGNVLYLVKMGINEKHFYLATKHIFCLQITFKNEFYQLFKWAKLYFCNSWFYLARQDKFLRVLSV